VVLEVGPVDSGAVTWLQHIFMEGAHSRTKPLTMVRKQKREKKIRDQDPTIPSKA
jgi:hypothetical protein